MPDRFSSQRTTAAAPMSIAIDHRNPSALRVSGSPATFMPKIPVIKVAGMKTVVTMANTLRLRLVCSAVLIVTFS